MKTEDLDIKEIIFRARSKGVEDIEIYIIEAKTISVEVNSGEVEGLEESSTSGYGVRLIKDGRLGFSYSTIPDEVDKVLLRAIESARFVGPDESLIFPEPSGFYHNVNIFDPAIDSANRAFIIDAARELEKAAFKADDRIKKTRKASVTLTSSKKTLTNSRGINLSFKSTTCICQIMVVAEQNGESQSAWEFEGSRYLKDISFKDVGERAAKKAVSLLGSRKISPRKSVVLFEPSVASEFLGFLASSFSGEEVLKGKSMLIGKIGQRVFSPLIDIIDNALLPGKLGTRPFDAEGVSSRINQLVSEGIVHGYLHNTYTAKRTSSINTANATRSSYADLPLVGISNFYIAPSTKTTPFPVSEMLNAEKELLYVLELMGMHTANPVTGDFSIGVSGLWIKNGSPIFSVKEAMIAGNVIDLFSKIIAVGDDLRFYGHTGSGHLLFWDVDISG